MLVAQFDLGGSAGKGLRSPGKTLLAAAPSASSWGAVAINRGCRCLKTPIPGAVMGFRGSHVLPLCPLPLPVCVCSLFLSQCFPCKNYLRNPPVSWSGLFYPVEQDLCCWRPVGSHICSPFPCRIPPQRDAPHPLPGRCAGNLPVPSSASHSPSPGRAGGSGSG